MEPTSSGRKKKKKQDFTECDRRFNFSFSFFGSRSRCPTARAADSTRLWMCRVREKLPYPHMSGTAEARLTALPAPSPFTFCSFRGRGESLGHTGQPASPAVSAHGFSHFLSLWVFFFFFLNESDCQQLYPGSCMSSSCMSRRVIHCFFSVNKLNYCIESPVLLTRLVAHHFFA